VARVVFFHLGLHKTATSWLQNQLFPKLPLPVHRTQKLEKLDDKIARHSEEAILISHEGLGGCIDDSKAPGDALRTFQTTLAHIARSWPNGKILIGFREHVAWMNSAYTQRAKKCLVTPEQYHDSFSLDDLLWVRRVELCEQYGLESFFFLYEEFANDPSALLLDLCGFLGTPVPVDAHVLLAERENTSPRTEQGIRISRVAYSAVEALSGLPGLKHRLRKKRLRNFALRLGTSFDSGREPPRITLAPCERERLQADWNEVVRRVSLRRQRNFSAFFITTVTDFDLCGNTTG
jgi:hypothetical protein